LQHTDRPTRQRGTDTPHTLDLVLTYGFSVQDIEYRSPLGSSDHSVVSFQCARHIENVCTTNKFKWDKRDYERLNEFLNINWDDVLDSWYYSVDEMWENFKRIVLDGMNKYIPRGGQARGNLHKNSQPFNSELHALIR